MSKNQEVPGKGFEEAFSELLETEPQSSGVSAPTVWESPRDYVVCPDGAVEFGMSGQEFQQRRHEYFH